MKVSAQPLDFLARTKKAFFLGQKSESKTAVSYKVKFSYVDKVKFSYVYPGFWMDAIWQRSYVEGARANSSAGRE